MFEARGVRFLTVGLTGALAAILFATGCATSRENEYVAATIAEAMVAPPVTGNGATAEPSREMVQLSVSPPHIVSVAPGGTVTAVPAKGVSVTAPVETTVLLPSKVTSTTVQPEVDVVTPPPSALAGVTVRKETLPEDEGTEPEREAAVTSGAPPFTAPERPVPSEPAVFVAPLREPGKERFMSPAQAEEAEKPVVARAPTVIPVTTPEGETAVAPPDVASATAGDEKSTTNETGTVADDGSGTFGPSGKAGVAGWRVGMLKPAPPTIRPDTVLWISVTEDPSLNGRYSVNNSSAIDFGYVGLVFLHDMTPEQAEATLRNVLEGRYLNRATVSVKIAKASYDFVGVMGTVEVPGELKIGPGSSITLNEALRRAGGLRGNKESNRVKIVRGGLRTPFGPAGEGEVYSLVSPGGQLNVPDVFLRNNDLVYVFAQQSGARGTGVKRVILLGEVPRRGVVEFTESEPCTLMYLLFKIGGLPRFAKADKIQVVRRDKNGREKAFVVNGDSLMTEGNPQDDVVLESGDRIIVPARKIAFF